MTDELCWKHFARHHGVLGREEALALGMTNRQIGRRRASGEWIEAERQVYRHAAVPVTWEARALAAALSAGGLVSHLAAARVWRLDGFVSPRVDVVVAEAHFQHGRSSTVHRSRHMHLAGATVRNSLPVTGIARTVLDVAAAGGSKRLNRAVDSALRMKLVTWQQLYSVLVRHSAQGRDGCGRLRHLLEDRYGDNAIPDSNWNRDVATLITDGGLPAPVFEHVVHRNGQFIARVDLAYPGVQLAIECDSVRWHANSVSFVRDPRRRNALLNAGWRVLSFTWDDYANQPSQLVATVADALAPAMDLSAN